MDEKSNSEVLVSVLCLAYNHEKYIRQTLEGFVMQKTDFRYEVIVHDDASTDETARIIREYAEKYPELITAIYQKENQRSQKISIWKNHVNHRIRGRYVALCEGDDYWTSEEKLQKQVRTMENNPSCAMCVHKIQEVKADGSPTPVFRPSAEIQEGIVDLQQFLYIRHRYPFQTASYFMLTDLWLQFTNDPPPFKKVISVGDEPMLLFMAAHGDIYYLQECMSAYRTFSEGSWSASNKRDYRKRQKKVQDTYHMMQLFAEFTNHQYDYRLDWYEAHALWVAEEYRTLAGKEKRHLLKQLTFKNQVFALLSAYFPFFGTIRKTMLKILLPGGRK